MKDIRRYEYTAGAAKTALAWIAGIAVLGPAVSLWPRHGQPVGWAVAGLGSMLFGGGWFLWRRHRNRVSWVPIGRTLGFRYLYSGHFPELPFETRYEALDTLARSSPVGDLYVGHWAALNIHEADYTNHHQEDSYQLIPVETFALYRLPTVNVAAFEIDRLTFADRLWRRRGLSIPSHSRFSDRYRFVGPSELELAAWLPGPFLDLVCRHSDWHIQANGSWLLLSRTRHRVRSAKLPGFVEETDALAAALTGQGVR